MPIITHWLHFDAPACTPDGTKDGKILTRTPALISCEACKRIWMLTEQTGEPESPPAVQAFFTDPYIPSDDKTVVIQFDFPPELLDSMNNLGVKLADLAPATPDTRALYAQENAPAPESQALTPAMLAKANLPLIRAGFDGFYLFPEGSAEDQEQRRLEKEYLAQLESEESIRNSIDDFIEAVANVLGITPDAMTSAPPPANFPPLPKPQPSAPPPPYQFGVGRRRFDPSKRGRR